jgi:hypothetical protein
MQRFYKVTEEVITKLNSEDGAEPQEFGGRQLSVISESMLRNGKEWNELALFIGNRVMASGHSVIHDYPEPNVHQIALHKVSCGYTILRKFTFTFLGGKPCPTKNF